MQKIVFATYFFPLGMVQSFALILKSIFRFIVRRHTFTFPIKYKKGKSMVIFVQNYFPFCYQTCTICWDFSIWSDIIKNNKCYVKKYKFLKFNAEIMINLVFKWVIGLIGKLFSELFVSINGIYYLFRFFIDWVFSLSKSEET